MNISRSIRLYVIPDRKIGVIVLSNTATRMDELGINILELMSR